MSTYEDLEAEGRAEASRERAERLYGPEPEPWANCATCRVLVDPDEDGVGCEECEAVMHRKCALATPEGEEASAYICKRCAALTQSEIAYLNEILRAEDDAQVRERRVAIPTSYRDPRVLLAALASLPAKELSQWGGALHFVYSVWDCKIQHGDLIVRASKGAAERIGFLISQHYADAWRAERRIG